MAAEGEEKKTFAIKSVFNPADGTEVSLQQAIMLGIIQPDEGVYIDSVTGQKKPIPSAMSEGLIKVMFTSTKRVKEKTSSVGIITVKTTREGDGVEPETVIKKYAVRAVVDRRQNKTVTFHDAVRRGIIDRDSGSFRDTLTGDRMYVGDAIMRGFLKARVIDDDSGLDIDPENKMVVEKTETIRKRLLKPLGVISAFKMAAAAGRK